MNSGGNIREDLVQSVLVNGIVVNFQQAYSSHLWKFAKCNFPRQVPKGPPGTLDAKLKAKH